MNKATFGRLVRYDCKGGFWENKVKWAVAIFLLAYLSNGAIEKCMELADGLGFWGYLTYLLWGMPEYLRDRPFELPVAWLLYYGYLFFLVGFYPISNLYGCGKKALAISGSRRKWLLSKYLWTAINILAYYLAMCLVLLLSCALKGFLHTGGDAMRYGFGIDVGAFVPMQVFATWFLLPFLTAVAMAFVQLTISVCVNALAGYTVSIVMLVVSTYWMRPFLLGNYLMLARYDTIAWSGISMETGFLYAAVVIVVSVVLGCVLFRRKDIL